MRVVMIFALVLGACDSIGAPDVAEGAITNGTTTPTLTPLSASEILAIGYLANPSGDPFCSGTVITRHAVLTAQHCVDGKAPGDVRFGIGTPGSPLRLLKVTRIARADWESDIALLNLETDASAVGGLQAIAVNRSALGSELIGESVEIAGYAPVDGSWTRRFAPVTVTNVYDALALNGNDYYGACQGDSGGPVLLIDGTGRATVGGTAIGGHMSCRDDMYYSRADRQIDWIDETLATFTLSSSGSSGGTGGGDPWGCENSDCSGGIPPNALALITALGVLHARRAHLNRRRTR